MTTRLLAALLLASCAAPAPPAPVQIVVTCRVEPALVSSPPSWRTLQYLDGGIQLIPSSIDGAAPLRCWESRPAGDKEIDCRQLLTPPLDAGYPSCANLLSNYDVCTGAAFRR